MDTFCKGNMFSVYIFPSCKAIETSSQYKLNDPNIFQVKVKFSLEQAIKAQRGSRGIALLFL
jgi:hypothetical protein